MTLDRDAATGAAAPWYEPELGVLLTEEAREYEEQLCREESRRTPALPTTVQRELERILFGVFTAPELLDALQSVHRRLTATEAHLRETSLVHIRGRGVFTQTIVQDHPGREGINTIVLIRWNVDWESESDAYTVSCEFYAPAQPAMQALTLHHDANAEPTLTPPVEFSLPVEKRIRTFPNHLTLTLPGIAHITNSIFVVCSEIGSRHGYTARRIAQCEAEALRIFELFNLLRNRP